MGCYYIYKSGEGSLSTLKESLKEVTESELQDYIDSSEDYVIGRTVAEVERILANRGIFDDELLYREDPSLVFYDASVSPREETLIKLQKAIERKNGKKHYAFCRFYKCILLLQITHPLFVYRLSGK